MKLNLKNIVVVIISTLLLLFIILFILKKCIYKDKYLDIIIDNNECNGIDPYIILSIIKAESNFNEKAISNKGAKGLMQLTSLASYDVLEILEYDSVQDLDLYNPEYNIKFGIIYLNSLLHRYNGNYYLAICAYNAGIGNVDSWLDKGIITSNLDTKYINSPFKETNNYLKKVINNYTMYKLLY